MGSLLLAAAGLFGLYRISGRFEDVDVYWHVRVGNDILTHHRFTGDPSWVFDLPHHSWVTTQWLSEVLMAMLYNIFGWRGETLIPVVSGCLVTLLLTTKLRDPATKRLSPWAKPMVAIALVCVAIDGTERPLAISFVFVAILGLWARDALVQGTWPRLWVMMAFTLLWVQFHGYWVFVPAVIALVTVIEAAARRAWTPVIRGTTFFVATAACGFFSPAWGYSYEAPFVFRNAASDWLTEWQRPSIEDPVALAGLAFIAIAIWLLIRAVDGEGRTWSILYVTVLFLFGVVAYRNITPVVLLTVPLLATFAGPSGPGVDRTPGRVRLPSGVVSGLSAGVAGVFLLVRLLSGGALPTWTPYGLYEHLAHEPGQRRVFVMYDLAGQTMALGGPHVQVNIDGRADLWGNPAITRNTIVERGEAGWQSILKQLNPTDVLIEKSSPVVAVLEHHGWAMAAQTPYFVLLNHPS